MKYLKELQTTKWNIAGAEITANKEQAGPPVAKPINIEIKGDKFEELVENARKLKRFLEESEVPGVAELKTEVRAIAKVPRLLVKPLLDSSKMGFNWPVFLTRPVV